MEHSYFPPLSRVAVCGGTHGNELSGVYLVRELQKQKMDQTGSFTITPVLSNPRAVDVCRRYTDTDLNRCFTKTLLSSPITDTTPFEIRRAQELNAQLGPKGSEEAVDLIIDIHNTTANMGLCLLFYSSDMMMLHVYKYIQNKMPSLPVRAIMMDAPLSEAYSLDSVGKHGFSIEVGPQPNGVLRADIFNMVKKTLDLTIEWLQKYNSGCTFEAGEVEVFTSPKSVDYPRDPVTAEMTAAIHPQLQDADFKLLQRGDPMFLSFTGDTVKYDGEDVYPVFVNECAYYEAKTAFKLAQKTTVTFPSISVKKD